MEHGPHRGVWLLALSVCSVAGCSGALSTPGSDAGAGDPDAGTYVCEEGHWDDDGDAATPCVPWSDCTAGTYQITQGTATADRVCRACEVGTFSETINAKACLDHARCPPGTRVVMEGTAQSDRACDLCESGYFTTFWNSSTCAPLSECSPGTQQTQPATVVKNVECADCAPGMYCAGGSAQPAACAEGTWDTDQNPASLCSSWTDCAPGFYVLTPGTSLTDRNCSPCADGLFSGVNAVACGEAATCDPGSSRKSTDLTVCEPCAAGSFCAGGAAAAVPCSIGTWDDDTNAATSCVAMRDCAAGNFVSMEGSALSDRVCSPCGDGTFSTSSNASSCTPFTVCSADAYESASGTAVSDRQCAPYVSCLDRLTRAPDSQSGSYQVDPDGVGPNPAILVTCDMTTDGGGYTVISFEDFASDASGWSDARRDTSSSCFTAYGAMLGGFGLFGNGASSTKTYALLGIAHSQVRVDLDYIIIDSWDGERAVVSMDGTLVYDVAFRMDTTQVCGGGWGERGPQQVTVTRSHTVDTLLLNVTSTVDQSADDESFGVDNVRVMVR